MLLSKRETSVQPARGSSNNPHLMLFAPWYYGHHATYLGHLIRYWQQHNLPGRLSIVVMPTFLEKHPDVVAIANACPNSRFVAMTAEEQVWLESAKSPVGNAMVQYQLLVRYATRLGATQGLLTHLDSIQVPLVLGKKLPCPFSGIYFRPTFHYTSFANYMPTRKERIQHLKERLFLFRLLTHPQFKSLFCLDPLAIAPINQRDPKQTKAVYLPDPIEFHCPPKDAVMNFRQQLGIEPERRAFLMFGSLAEGRKGTQQLLESVFLLEPDLCQKLCLVLVGEAFPDRQRLLETWLEPIRQSLPVQIVTRFGYVPEADVPLYFQVADGILAPYLRHAGMSGILLQAASAGKPVLSSSYGLMGELVQQYELGVAVDTTVPHELAQGLSRLLSQPFEQLCNVEQMRTLAKTNSPEQFAGTIFQTLYNS
ncbi:MAG: glycosyltransferase family 4 protein [Leptodesmis sp.]|uniref:glycosyltransferase family 4 protein n=1 Tax=Leptodesmis sp. TaxID=3100501 RepID=UPI003D12EB80